MIVGWGVGPYTYIPIPTNEKIGKPLALLSAFRTIENHKTLVVFDEYYLKAKWIKKEIGLYIFNIHRYRWEFQTTLFWPLKIPYNLELCLALFYTSLPPICTIHNIEPNFKDTWTFVISYQSASKSVTGFLNCIQNKNYVATHQHKKIKNIYENQENLLEKLSTSTIQNMFIQHNFTNTT